MKNCIVVNYWADTEEKVKIVIDCINQLKKTGKDIIYTSLTPIDERIQSIVKFSLYNNDNNIITFQEILDNKKFNIFINQNYTTDLFSVSYKPINWVEVSITILNQFNKNFKFLKQIGYDSIHFFVGDSIISDKDIQNILSIEEKVISLNKKAYFEDLILNQFGGYQTLYFYTELDFYLKVMSPTMSKQDWIEKSGDCLEGIFSNYFSEYSDETLVIKNLAESEGKISLFQDSKDTIDLISVRVTTDYCVVWNSKDNIFELFILSLVDDVIEISINGKIKYNINITPHNWYKYSLLSTKFELKIVTLTKTYNLSITDENIDKLKSCCTITYFHPTISDEIKKEFKIKLLHLQTTTNDTREILSRESLKKVFDFGVNYVLHQNEVFSSLPPVHNCLRPHNVRLEKYTDINDPEYGNALTPTHYGCFESFKLGIMSEFDKDLDFLIVCEGDCIIETPIEEFVNKVNQVCEIVNNENISYFSFGDTKTLDFGWHQSDVVREIPNQDLLFITDKIIGLQCIMFPTKTREYLINKLRTEKWDCMDTFFNIIFSGKNMGILKNRITTQADGYSLIDKELKTFIK
jgi:hypothetical protein